MKKTICVYCGSSTGTNKGFQELAKEIGHLLAEKNIRLVYGGGNVGLMGIMADASLEKGGKVLGIIPKHLVDWEVAHQEVSELKIVNSMHERKALMEKESDAFLAIPGGLGTLDELFEILTWKQLKLHKKPISIINSEGFFTPLLNYLKSSHQYGFISKEHLNYVKSYDSLKDWQNNFL